MADLIKIAATAADNEGALWTLEASDDLNANLVSFRAGRGVGEHANTEVDVLLIGMAGSGVISVNGVEHQVYPGVLVLVPNGVRRAIRSSSDDFSYLTVHQRRGPLRLGTVRKVEEG
ncbi:MAG: cupin domain-containing protein [Rubrobacteraceae bacterium]